MFSSTPELELVIILLLLVGGPVTPVQLQARNVSSLTRFQVLSYFTLLPIRSFDPQFPTSEARAQELLQQRIITVPCMLLGL